MGDLSQPQQSPLGLPKRRARRSRKQEWGEAIIPGMAILLLLFCCCIWPLYFPPRTTNWRRLLITVVMGNRFWIVSGEPVERANGGPVRVEW